MLQSTLMSKNRITTASLPFISDAASRLAPKQRESYGSVSTTAPET